jgi:hypothetical protein
VAGDDHTDAVRGRVDGQLGEIVHHMDAHIADLHGLRRAYAARPERPVVVPADRGERRERAQLGEDLQRPDVAGVDDVRRAAQPLDRRGPQEAVGVGDEADPHRPVRRG